MKHVKARNWVGVLRACKSQELGRGVLRTCKSQELGRGVLRV